MQSQVGFALAVFSFASVVFADEAAVRFERAESELRIFVGDQPFARYVFRDEKILRPYFTDVHAPDGTRVTRHHPPREGIDATDHDTMHPGIWIAFGDLSGADFWRNKARVEHVSLTENGSAFTARNRYLDGDTLVCEEEFTARIVTRSHGTYLLLDSDFTAGARPFYFGDQEEMGLGVRVATPLAVKNGGRIVNSDGLRDEAGCWGRTALWANYGGTINGVNAGMVVMPHPENFRPSWFHARDYGFIAANPFGRKAFTGGEESRVEVAVGESLRLAYGVYIYGQAGGANDPASVYAEYLKLIDGPADKSGKGGNHAE